MTANGSRGKNAREALESVMVSLEKLKYIGISEESISGDIASARHAYRRREYDTALKYAARANATADRLKNLYRDTCIAMATAGDCLKSLDECKADSSEPRGKLREARKAFEESDFERAYRHAMDAAASMVSASDSGIMRRGGEIPAHAKNAPLPKICKWRIPQHGRGASLCLNMLGRNYKKSCNGDADCEYMENRDN